MTGLELEPMAVPEEPETPSEASPAPADPTRPCPPIRLGLVGVGEIARAKHLPTLASGAEVELVATASPKAGDRVDGIPAYRSIEDMLRAGHGLDAVSLCMPPAGRHAVAAMALEHGLHVMLEKPPAATVTEILDLAGRAEGAGLSLFATWHSREGRAVDAAKDWLSPRRIDAVRVCWAEDIRRWHPGQEWILAAGGFGVLDPGINALSILTHILPEPILPTEALLGIPDGRDAPIQASLAFRSGPAAVEVELDFLRSGQERWDIEVSTDRGILRLEGGGSRLRIEGAPAVTARDEEYPRLYSRFADLVRNRRSDVDIRPLQLAADIFLIGKRRRLAPFEF